MKLRSVIICASAALIAAGCASTAPETGLIADPQEGLNRDIHEFNKGLDTAFVQPAAEVYDVATPAFLKTMISNELKHLQLPRIFINRVLQAEAEKAGIAAGRFGVNTVIGIGGLFDPATEMGLPFEQTDFGETLAVWGFEEGIYHEAPFFGPSTTRHLVGRFVDFALDPTILLTAGVVDAPRAITIASAARTPAGIVNARHENDELIDEIFYRSDDSYVTAKTGYIQLRRRQVAGETDTEALPDIFE